MHGVAMGDLYHEYVSILLSYTIAKPIIVPEEVAIDWMEPMGVISRVQELTQ